MPQTDMRDLLCLKALKSNPLAFSFFFFFVLALPPVVLVPVSTRTLQSILSHQLPTMMAEWLACITEIVAFDTKSNIPLSYS